MTNQVAFVLALVIAGAIGYDFAYNDSAFSYATAREFVQLINYMRFWD